MKKRRLPCLLALCLLLTACRRNPSEEQLFARLTAYLEAHGLPCTICALEEDCEVPIYRASAWRALKTGEETLLVYFDESNRSDYLSTFVDPEKWPHTACFGLRFIVVYTGENEQILQAMQGME